MKVLHISSPKTWRGGEQQLAYLVEELVKLGPEQQVLCRKDSVLEQWCKDQTISYSTHSKMAGIDPFMAQRIAKVSKEFHPDLIHIHDAHAHTMAILAKDFFLEKTPIILSRRVDFPVKKSTLSAYKYNHPSVHSFICVSQAVADILSPSLKDSQKISVVYDGIDLSKFSESSSSSILRETYSIPADHLVIGNVAAITQQKDYFTFVETVALLKDDFPASYFIIGKGHQRPQIEAYIRHHGLSKRIILTGFREDIPTILPELDLLLFSSETEGLGTSLMDAMAAGVPIVSTEAGGISEFLTDRKNALLAPVKDSEKLAANVRELVRDSSLRKAIKQQALEDVQAFSKEKMAKATLAVYQEVLDHINHSRS